MSDERNTEGRSPIITNKKTPEEIIDSMSRANRVLSKKLGLAIARLRSDSSQFAHYEQLHRAKGTTDGNEKAETNRQHTDAIGELLSKLLDPNFDPEDDQQG